MSDVLEPAAILGPVSPFFIVRDVARSIACYRKMGFDLRFSEPDEAPFFAIVGRQSAQIFLKQVSDAVAPQPNATRHEWAPWDGFVYVADPDALAAEFDAPGTPLSKAIHERDDGLRGFEVRDADGYVLFFGGPG